jgi:hypothetical protein
LCRFEAFPIPGSPGLPDPGPNLPEQTIMAAADARTAAPVDAALNFLTEHGTYRSGAAFREVVGALQRVSKKDQWAFFLAPIEARLLSFEKALLWLFFVHSLPEDGPAARDPNFVCLGLDAIRSIYDLDFEDQLAVHWNSVETDDEEDD